MGKFGQGASESIFNSGLLTLNFPNTLSLIKYFPLH